MESNRPIVLSIAGVDPSAGAGLLADIKTFEQHKVYGLGISTAQTVQTENKFLSVRWEEEEGILKAIETMLSHYKVRAIKIGIVENISRLEKIVFFIHQKNRAIKIIVDTVIKSSSGFNFWNGEMKEDVLEEILNKTFLITPNYNEALQLGPAATNAKEAAEKLSAHCAVLLKGGHNNEEPGIDYLYMKDRIEKLEGSTNELYAKHGSGCVLSAAITANLALGVDLINSCKSAKQYIEKFLAGNKTLLGYHVS